MTGVHGGDIYRNQVRMDFSVNTNPLGCTEALEKALVLAAKRVGEYPDITQIRVREAIAGLQGVSPENVLCGNGASELITGILQLLRPGRVLLTAPSFYGYEHAAKGIPGCEILRYELKEEEGFALTEHFLTALTEDVDICILCNPNNPTGVRIDPELLQRIAERCGEKKIPLLMDECFEEMAEGAVSLIPRMGEFRNLFILKAFTKLLAVPGVRFGYVISAEENILKLCQVLPEWNLSVFAEEAALAGCRVLGENGFREKTAELLGRERRYLVEELEKLSLRVIPGCANFLFFRAEKDLYPLLLSRGILIRDCVNYPGLEKGYYRLAVKTHEENEELIHILREVL